MLQRNWTIHQGNVPRLSVWPRRCPGHPLGISVLLKLALSVSQCVSDTGSFSGSCTEG